MIDVREGDCLEVMRRMVERGEVVQAIVTDPPYDLVSRVQRFGKEGSAPAKPGTDGAFVRMSKGFMGREWDGTGIAFNPETWRLCYDLLPPGGHLLAFGGTRTSHRMVCAIEDAGFEIRDMIMWVFGTGFPKSHDVSKGIDKAAGMKRTEVIGSKLGRPGMAKDGSNQRSGFDAAFGGSASGVLLTDITAPATDAARQWQGWGSALKPGYEPIVVARKPLSGTLAETVLAHGTGALNIDATRIPTKDFWAPTGLKSGPSRSLNGGVDGSLNVSVSETHPSGRWPANLVHDGSEQVEAAFAAFGESKSTAQVRRNDTGAKNGNSMNRGSSGGTVTYGHADAGTASRFFASCPPAEDDRRFYYSSKAGKADRAGSRHPTVKPISLLRWLVRLVTPPGGTILDPFAGSGTTGAAALAEGFNCILIEREWEYLADIYRRFGMTLSLPVLLHTTTAEHKRLAEVWSKSHEQG